MKAATLIKSSGRVTQTLLWMELRLARVKLDCGVSVVERGAKNSCPFILICIALTLNEQIFSLFVI